MLKYIIPALAFISFNAISCENGKKTITDWKKTDSSYQDVKINAALLSSKACFIKYRSTEDVVKKSDFFKILSFESSNLITSGVIRSKDVSEVIARISKKLPIYVAFNIADKKDDDIYLGIYTHYSSEDQDIVATKSFTEINFSDMVEESKRARHIDHGN